MMMMMMMMYRYQRDHDISATTTSHRQLSSSSLIKFMDPKTTNLRNGNGLLDDARTLDDIGCVSRKNKLIYVHIPKTGYVIFVMYYIVYVLRTCNNSQLSTLNTFLVLNEYSGTTFEHSDLFADHVGPNGGHATIWQMMNNAKIVVYLTLSQQPLFVILVIGILVHLVPNIR